LVLLADIELPASRTKVMVARVDAFLISSYSYYAAAIGLTPLL